MASAPGVTVPRGVREGPLPLLQAQTGAARRLGKEVG